MPSSLEDTIVEYWQKAPADWAGRVTGTYKEVTVTVAQGPL